MIVEGLVGIMTYARRKRMKKKFAPHSLAVIIPKRKILGIPYSWDAYYCFNSISELPMVRRMHIDAFIKREADMNIDNATLTDAIDTILMFLDPDEYGRVRIGDAIAILNEVKKRTMMLTLPEHLYKVAALCFFKHEDDLNDWLSPDELTKRAEALKKKIPLKQLLGESMGNILQTLQFSKEDLRSYSAFHALETQIIADRQKVLFSNSKKERYISQV